MKKIGFVDHYLSEWHANNYPAWIAEVCESLGTEYKVAYAWAELGVSPVDGVTTAEWCEKYGVESCDTLDELCDKSDIILILAPSSPEKHLQYAETVLKYGKRTYIDKTFAPDHATACQIFELAKKYNVPFFSSSALRYATELDAVKEPTSVITTGGGRLFNEYIIHQCEMVIKKLGTDPCAVSVSVQGTQRIVKIAFTSGKQATMIYGKNMPFSIYMQTDSGSEDECWQQISSPFFKNLIADMIRFFETGIVSFDTEQTKAVIKLIEASIAACGNPECTIQI